MGVTVGKNRHGYLVLRIFHRGREEWVGVKLRDDGPEGKNRRQVEAWAHVIDNQLVRGVALHVALISVLGDCPPRLMPTPTEKRSKVTVREVCAAHMERLRDALARGDARKTLVSKTQTYIDAVIVPFWGDTLLSDVTLARLIGFQADVMKRERKRKIGGKVELVPIATKTVKNIVGGHFQAIVRKARAIHGVPVVDPFDGLEWPRRRGTPEPDPFTAAERDKILEFFRDRRPRWYPWLALLFWAGLRQGESTPLVRSDLDSTRGTLRVTKSFTEGEENEPKTSRSTRTIALLPEAIAALRLLPEQATNDPDALLFVNPNGEIINSKEWPKHSFYPVLRKLGIRVRKFYATRHTFATEMIARGENRQALADYMGTSPTMLERSYARWIGASSDPSVKTLGSRSGRDLPVTLEADAVGEVVNFAEKQGKKGVVPRGIEPRKALPETSEFASKNRGLAQLPRPETTPKNPPVSRKTRDGHGRRGSR